MFILFLRPLVGRSVYNELVRWEAQNVGRLLGTRIHPLLCVHGATTTGPRSPG
jgi:hypothetical protein